MFQFVLGSQSPRRKEILEYFDIPFTQSSPNFDEDLLPFEGNPENYVNTLSKGKGESLAPVYPDALILTADSIVYQDGVVYGKPKDTEDVKRILKCLSGTWHSVYTGIRLQRNGIQFHKTEETKVLFNELSEEHIQTYISRCPWKDKAGGYGIQMGGGLLVKKIDGCYYNVMGLPINALSELFLNFGIDLWKHIKPNVIQNLDLG